MQSTGYSALVRHFRVGILAVVLLLGSVVVTADDTQDRIYLRTGGVLTGEIVHADGSEVRIAIGGIETTITTDRIERIERAARLSPGAEQASSEARRLLDANDPVGAMRAMQQYLAAGDSLTSANAVLARRSVTGTVQVYEQALSRADTTQVRRLLDLLQEDATRELAKLAWADGATTPDPLPGLLPLLRQGRLLLVNEQRRAGNLDDAEAAIVSLREQISPTDSLQAELSYEYGAILRERARIAWDDRRLEDAEALTLGAIEAFRSVTTSGTTNHSLAQNATQEGNNLRNTVLPRIRDELRPPPTPQVVVVRTPVPTPMPTPEPTPVPSRLDNLVGAERMTSIHDKMNQLMPEGMESRRVIDAILYIIAFIVGFLVIPKTILRVLSKRGDIVADRWVGRVWFLGPIALVGYAVGFLRHKAGARRFVSKHPCPSCKAALDNALLFDNLDFSHCPSCGADIEPIHSIDTYIMMMANSLATDAEKVVLGVVSMQSFVTTDAMQKLTSGITTKAARMRASDIHIEPQQDHVAVRLRVDGVMMDALRLPGSLGAGLVSALKVMADLDISEKRKPQDGRLEFDVDGIRLDIRMATSPSMVGETVTMRLLDMRSIQVDLKQLGMSRSTREVYEAAIREPHGLMLLCGPTGSGKTTSIYVSLRMLANGDRNIISIEDPIEFRIQGVNQIQVNPVAGLTFATGLRSILRQDPDVVVIGEIRDKETAEIAVSASQTGHLVFSTLHTIDAPSSVTRLFDFGINARQFANALLLAAAQRLIRLVCPHCKKTTKITDQNARLLGLVATDLQQYEFVMGAGCPRCTKTGYFGRTGLFEMLTPNSAMRTSLENSSISTAELRELAIANGMRTLREEALVLLRQGLTTPDEVLRVTK